MNSPATSAGPSGAGLKTLGVALVITGVLLYAVLGGPDDDPIGLFCGLLVAPGILLYFRGRQQAAKKRATGPQSPIYDSRPHVLYLRSFQTDVSTPFQVLTSGFSGFAMEEQQLADALRPLGEMVAIGRPGEHLPTLGAARIYATDAEWKSVVLTRMQSAPLVVIRPGTGAGLLWEFEQAFRTLDPEKVLLFIFNLKIEEYTGFATDVRNAFHITLPVIGTFSSMRAIINYADNPSKVLPGFIRFSGDWRPEFLPLPLTIIRSGNKVFKKSFIEALQPVFERRRRTTRPTD